MPRTTPSPIPPEAEYITGTQLADRYQVDARTIRREVERGRLVPARRRPELAFHRDEIARYEDADPATFNAHAQPVLTAAEVAGKAAHTVARVNARAARGSLRAFRVGQAWRFRERDVAAWLKEGAR